jgi:hypothetical protein
MEEKRVDVAEQPNLLPEYQACQYHIQTIDMRLWQSAAILIGASFATLAVLAREEASTAFCAGLSLGALAAATVFSLWARIWKRRDASVAALETRMREIEWRTGMRKVIYFGILRRWDERTQLDDWERLPPAERAVLETSYGPLPGPAASFMLFAAAMIAAAGWPALAIAKTVELAAK